MRPIAGCRALCNVVIARRVEHGSTLRKAMPASGRHYPAAF